MQGHESIYPAAIVIHHRKYQAGQFRMLVVEETVGGKM